MGELVLWDSYDPAPINRRTAKQVSRVRDQQIVARAAIEAREQNAAYVASLRNDNGYMLADRVVTHAARLNWRVTQLSQDNPGLEMTGRKIEESVAFDAMSVIHWYMTR